ncbi:lipase family protein [Photobacterium sp. DNB23_23_1]|uniref:Lipase n=1 Tax=Photobacterium pectinilyticum TaxID=2906793 RepID=A0ABT1MWM1_9GAMM|nr:lipase [Photobacterium sp. ZSDE20]MCQ1056900.1 lipase [Photobacterium sp. ZSDE20]MDD1821035.1 lipase [Photobacterium sp. ZSDE20]
MKPLKRYQYERYAILCNLAYPPTFNHTLYGFDKNGRHEITDRWGRSIIRILWGERNEVVVVFKGSQSLSDWLINLAFFPKKIQSGDQFCHVHWGYYSLLEQSSKTNTIRPNPHLSEAMNTEFMQASEKNVKQTALTLYQQIESVLLPLIAQGKRITLTGHSSGGAMAILVAHRLYQTQPAAVKRIVTFGQPAAGFWNFKQQYPLAKRTYRICCDLDIVTFLPPIPFMFWHVGKVLWLHNGKIYEDTPTLSRLYRSIISWVLRPITYHYMNKYIRNKDFFDKH